MNELVKATVKAEHRNGYGTKELKEVGDTYHLPRAMAVQLQDLGYITFGKQAAADKPKA